MKEVTGMQSPVTHDRVRHPPSVAHVERSVVEWLRAELDDPQIVGSDNFLDIGGHSLTFSRLNIFLTESFGVTLDMKTAYEHPISRAVAEMRPAEAAGEPCGREG